jgi:hypothetical protein
MAGAAIKLIVVTDEPSPAFFSSIEAAESYFEWQDVRDGTYPIAYDPDGNVYRFREDGWRVFIESDLSVKPDPEGLNALLHLATGIKSAENAFLLSLCLRQITY